MVRTCFVGPRSALACLAVVAAVVVACSEGAATEDPPGSTVSGACPASVSTPRTCGLSEIENDCNVCLKMRCCAQEKACSEDCDCTRCTETGNTAPCVGKNALYDNAITCLKASCAVECNPNPAGSSGMVSACAAINCVEGADGDQLCRQRGCGVRCLMGRCYSS